MSTADPRIVRSKAAIRQATFDLLLERGIAAATVDAIAARAGVSKATVYRHWCSRGDLVLETLDSVRPPVPDPHSADLRADLREMLRSLGSFLSSPAGTIVVGMIGAAEHDEEVCDLRRRIGRTGRERVQGLVRDAVEHGALPAGTDPDLAVSLLGGPVYHRRLFTDLPADEAFYDAVVDAALLALGYQPAVSPS